MVQALAELLERYSVEEVTVAIDEALGRGVPHPNAVRLALERRRQAQAEVALGRVFAGSRQTS